MRMQLLNMIMIAVLLALGCESLPELPKEMGNDDSYVFLKFIEREGSYSFENSFEFFVTVDHSEQFLIHHGWNLLKVQPGKKVGFNFNFVKKNPDGTPSSKTEGFKTLFFEIEPRTINLYPYLVTINAAGGTINRVYSIDSGSIFNDKQLKDYSKMIEGVLPKDSSHSFKVLTLLELENTRPK